MPSLITETAPARVPATAARQRFMRAKTLARELDISESLVWQWVAEGKLPQPKRPSPRVSLFDWEKVEEALA
jgi:predicted DNA-binding transcriptional regulator AlpA